MKTLRWPTSIFVVLDKLVPGPGSSFSGQDVHLPGLGSWSTLVKKPARRLLNTLRQKQYLEECLINKLIRIE